MIFELKYIFYNAKSTICNFFLGIINLFDTSRHLFFRAHRSRSEVAETYDGIPMYLIDLIVGGGERGHTIRAGPPLKI